MKTFDVRAWVVWLGSGALMAIYLRNPLYLVLLLLIARVVMMLWKSSENSVLQLPFWRMAILILLFSTIFNVLMAHFGETVLISLPENLYLIGGPLTLEAAVYGLINGLSLVVLLALFFTFNAVVPASQLTTLVPAALHELGLVLVIAITYIPETIRHFHRIRDAQAIRGHRLQGLRDWRPIMIPLLVGGLERAMNLAETMVARGYGGVSPISAPHRVRALAAAGLVCIFVGALRLGWQSVDGWFFLLVGGGFIVVAYRELSKSARRTHYRTIKWSWRDSIVVLSACIPLLLLSGVFPGMDRSALAYSPYPLFSVPPFELWVGASLLGLLAPGVLFIWS
jgi:energy-coupling factor transport system permease protein